jgi:hypothetical protein
MLTSPMTWRMCRLSRTDWSARFRARAAGRSSTQLGPRWSDCVMRCGVGTTAILRKLGLAGSEPALSGAALGAARLFNLLQICCSRGPR